MITLDRFCSNTNNSVNKPNSLQCRYSIEFRITTKIPNNKKFIYVSFWREICAATMAVEGCQVSSLPEIQALYPSKNTLINNNILIRDSDPDSTWSNFGDGTNFCKKFKYESHLTLDIGM
jgi:hypothetical protein